MNIQQLLQGKERQAVFCSDVPRHLGVKWRLGQVFYQLERFFVEIGLKRCKLSVFAGVGARAAKGDGL
jgi:hypothetical protein